MKYTLLLSLALTAVATTNAMEPNKQGKTKKTSLKEAKNNENIHNLFKQKRHIEAAKLIPSKPTSLIQYSEMANDPQFKLWVAAQTK